MAKILTRASIAWCLYDFGSSAYSTNVNAFILSAYFTEHIAKNPIIGTSQWGYAMAISALLVAFIAPFFGQYIDRYGSIRRWFISLNIITIFCVLSWWWVHPSFSHATILALSLSLISYFCYESAFVLYNGMLKSIAPSTHIGRLSGWAFAAGYAGGTCCLILVLTLLIKNSFHWEFLTHSYHGIRLVGPITAVWFLLFSLPLFLNIKTPPKTNSQFKLKNTLQSTWSQIVELRKEKTVLLFLIARLFYMDGLNSIFTFAGIYAAGTFGMNTEDIILFAISSQMFAFLGAMLFSKLDDSIGSLNCLRWSVLLLTVSTIALLIVKSTLLFWVAGMLLSTTVGPIQSCSRSYMTRISTDDNINNRFGLYALSGKITAFLGPWLIALMTKWTNSQRLGIIPTLILISLGLVCLYCIQPNDTKHRN